MGDLNTTTLVAIMFVMILSMAIANVLGALVHVVNRLMDRSTDWTYTSWMVLLLLMCLNLFWQTQELVELETPGFWTFIYIILGPVLLFLASSIHAPAEEKETSEQRRAHYLAASPRFFSLLAVSQLWILALDVVWEGGLTPSGFSILGAVGLLTVMANAQSVRVHAIGSGVAWVLFVGTAVLENAGVIA